MTKEQQREKLTKMTAAELNAVVAQTATDDYKEPPVDIETFLDDPYFLGDFFGGKLREVVRECLQDIFPSPYTNRYWLVALKGCKGWGKTWAAGAGLLYSAHKFLCMRDPQGFFGLGPETMLVFYIFNVTLSNSKTNKIDVVWDTIFRMIQTSPYFRNKMSEVKMSGDKLERAIFPNRIDFHAGSRVVHALGQAVACLTADTRIPLLDGREVAVGDLVKGLSTEEDIWVHSWDLDRKALVPGKVIAACRSGFRPVWRVYLDNGKYFDATDNHRMLMRSGEYLTVGDLRVGDAFLPFNLRKKEGHFVFRDPFDGELKSVHRAIARSVLGEKIDGNLIHHKNFNPSDNRPDNLLLMNVREHLMLHSKHRWKNLTIEEKKKAIEVLRVGYAKYFADLRDDPIAFDRYCCEKSRANHMFWNGEEASGLKESASIRLRNLWGKWRRDPELMLSKSLTSMENIKRAKWWIYSEENKNQIREAAASFRNDDWYASSREKHKKSMRNYYDSDRSLERRSKQKHVMSKAIGKFWNDPENGERKANAIFKSARMKIVRKVYSDVSYVPAKELVDRYFGTEQELTKCIAEYNHKVVNIEYLGVVPVYDIQIDNYQNFALSCGIISHNSAILDEANFEVIGGQVYQNFSELLRRMQTRFIKGTVWVVSSEQEKTSVLNSIIKRYEGQRGVKVVGHSIWEAVPSKFSGETFEMFPGSDTRPAFIVGEDNIEIPEEDKSRIIYVPVEYKGLAQADLGGFLRDMAGMETASKDRLFRQKDKLDAAMVLDPLFPDVIQLSFADVEDRIEDHMVRETPGYFGSIPFRGCPRYLHIDFGITGDRLGMAAVYSSGTIERTSGSNIPSLLSEIDKTTKNSFMRVPRVTVEWVLAIEAKKGFPVPLPRVSTFILWLKSMRYPITHISADGFQSAYFLQEMEMVGYKTVVISTDRTVEPYTSLREAVYDGRCALPRSNLLRKELLGLERSADGRKVDHAEDGSKDVADAVAGAAFAMLGDDKMRFIQKFAREDRVEERKGTSSEGLKELFWGSGSSAADHVLNRFGEQDWPRK